MAAGDGVYQTFQQLHPAFAAGAVAGAGGVDGHIGHTGQGQQVIAGVAFNHNRGSVFYLESYFHV